MNARKVGIVIVVVTLLMPIVGASGYFLGYKPYVQKKAKAQAAQELAKEKLIAQYRKKILERRAKRAAEAEARTRAEELQRRLKLATIRKGEGVEHAFIRQLIDKPNIMVWVKVKIGKREYDLTRYVTDERLVEKWAGRTAHLLAIFFGYVDKKTGRQIRIKKPGEVALLIEVDSGQENLDVVIYKKETKATEAEFSYEQFASTGWLGFDQPATFWADVKDGLGSYEYVWQSIKKSKKQKK